MWFKRNITNENTNKNSIDSVAYDELVKRLSNAVGRIGVLEVTLEAIKTDIANLRGKFSARLKGIKEEELKKEEETEKINNDTYLPFG